MNFSNRFNGGGEEPFLFAIQNSSQVEFQVDLKQCKTDDATLFACRGHLGLDRQDRLSSNRCAGLLGGWICSPVSIVWG
jgi:hypothetical protein